MIEEYEEGHMIPQHEIDQASVTRMYEVIMCDFPDNAASS